MAVSTIQYIQRSEGCLTTFRRLLALDAEGKEHTGFSSKDLFLCDRFCSLASALYDIIRLSLSLYFFLLRAAVKSIEDLSTIFKELAVLVIDQGTILDRIDFNMEQVRVH